MYGSIMRARLKPGAREGYEAHLRTLVPSAEDYGQGLHSIEMAYEDKDPDRVIVVVHFRDRESYLANANRPETDSEYRSQLEFLDGEPEWIDVNYSAYVGKPLTETVQAGA